MILSRSLTSALALAASLLASLPATAEMTLDPGTSVTFHHHDLLGSPVMVSDHKGRVLWYENTKPYGESLGKKSSSGLGHLDNSVNEATSNLGYTGHTVDSSTGLVYMKARHYDPVIGRFYSNDPVAFTALNTTMFNRYAYANNNPYRYTDPSGMYGHDITPEFQDQVPSNMDVDLGITSAIPGNHPGLKTNRGYDDADHDYTVFSASPVCSAERHCTYEEQIDFHSRFVWPDQSPDEPVEAGDSGPNLVKKPGTWAMFGGWVTSFFDGVRPSSTNSTTAAHIFHDGIVDRTSVLNPDGSWSVISRGTGTNLPGLGKVNQYFGPGIFEDMDDAMRDYISNH